MRILPPAGLTTQSPLLSRTQAHGAQEASDGTVPGWFSPLQPSQPVLERLRAPDDSRVGAVAAGLARAQGAQPSVAGANRDPDADARAWRDLLGQLDAATQLVIEDDREMADLLQVAFENTPAEARVAPRVLEQVEFAVALLRYANPSTDARVGPRLQDVNPIVVDLVLFDPERMGATLAARVNNALDPEFNDPRQPQRTSGFGDPRDDSDDIARLINTLHDAENAARGTDRIREDFARKLTPRTAVEILTREFGDLYTSSYNAILGGLLEHNDGDLQQTLSALELETSQQLGLLDILSKYGETETVQRALPLFLPVLLRAVEQPEAAADEFDEHVQHTRLARFAQMLGELWPDLTVGKREGAEAALVRALDGSRGARAAAGLVLRSLYESGETLSSSARDSASALPPLPQRPPAIAKWLEDGALTSKLYFYNDDPWYEDDINYYMDVGFQAAPDAEHWLKGATGRVLQRTRNGVVERIVLVMGDDGTRRQDDLDDPYVDVLLHRGHSYDFELTFPANVESGPHTKLIIGGACGSFALMASADFSRAYGRHLLLGDRNTGHGAVNRTTLMHLLNAVNDGARSWTQVGFERFVDQGAVLPDSPAFLFNLYKEELERDSH